VPATHDDICVHMMILRISSARLEFHSDRMLDYASAGYACQKGDSSYVTDSQCASSFGSYILDFDYKLGLARLPHRGCYGLGAGMTGHLCSLAQRPLINRLAPPSGLSVLLHQGPKLPRLVGLPHADVVVAS
jgi:hypothetical protein